MIDSDSPCTPTDTRVLSWEDIRQFDDSEMEWYPSFDDYREIAGLYLPFFLAAVRRTLPCRGADSNRVEKVRRLDYLLVQHSAYLLEDRLNPRRVPTADVRRAVAFCGRRREKVRSAAADFLSVFDQVLTHYGWHEVAERTAFDEMISFDSRGGFSRPDHADAVMTPPAIEEDSLHELERAGQHLWLVVVEDMGQDLDTNARKAMARTVLGLTPETHAIALLLQVETRDWTDQQIADAVGCSRTSLFRFKRYVALREIIKQEGRSNRRRGAIATHRSPSGRKDSSLEAFDEDTSLRSLFEGRGSEPIDEMDE